MGMSQFWYIRVDLVEGLWRVIQTHTYGKSPLTAENYCTHYPMHLHVHIQNTETKNDVLIQRIRNCCTSSGAQLGSLETHGLYSMPQ
eukprot:405994-Amphidinium_carterae.1